MSQTQACILLLGDASSGWGDHGAQLGVREPGDLCSVPWKCSHLFSMMFSQPSESCTIRGVALQDTRGWGRGWAAGPPPGSWDAEAGPGGVSAGGEGHGLHRGSFLSPSGFEQRGGFLKTRC